MPKKVGDCAVTHIAAITTRFGEPLDGRRSERGQRHRISPMGAAGLLRYGQARSTMPRSGDPVVMCLMSIPRDCPKGDDRGRVYYGLDVRTGGTWSLPDSQHMCGGA